MATHNGSEGLVHIGTAAVGELKSWSITENATMIDTTVLSSAAQTALTVGASVTTKFYFEGDASASPADKYYYGVALVESIDRSAAMDDIVGVSFSFRGTGALALGTVS